MRRSDQEFLAQLPSLGQFRSIICLNGNLPAKEFLEGLQLPIIATDGAYNTLRKIGAGVDTVIGDLDSVVEPLDSKVNWIKINNQDDSDFQKALKYAEGQHLMPAIILGINGGFLDHILHNIEIFSQTNCVGYDPPNLCFSLEGCRRFILPKNTKISFLGAPYGNVTTEGLRWELLDYELNFPYKSSCFNRCVKDGGMKISVHTGRVLLFIYLEDVIDAGVR